MVELPLCWEQNVFFLPMHCQNCLGDNELYFFFCGERHCFVAELSYVRLFVLFL